MGLNIKNAQQLVAQNPVKVIEKGTDFCGPLCKTILMIITAYKRFILQL